MFVLTFNFYRHVHNLLFDQERIVPEENITSFMSKWKELISLKGVRPELICNFDETMVQESKKKIKVIVPWEVRKVINPLPKN